MTSKLTLPCGHQVDETAANYIRTDIKNFYTCRQCQPAQPYRAEPFHWVPIVARERAPVPEASREEESLRQRLKDMVRERMRTKNKEPIPPGAPMD